MDEKKRVMFRILATWEKSDLTLGQFFDAAIGGAELMIHMSDDDIAKMCEDYLLSHLPKN